MLDWFKQVIFDEHSPLEIQGYENNFGFERKRPSSMETSHWHGHIEINYLFDCSADYLINGNNIYVPEGRMILFWASYPHQMTASKGDGEMVIIYIPLQAFLQWKFPEDFISKIIHGEVLIADSLHKIDQPLTRLWESNLETKEKVLMAQVLDEIRSRIRRMSLEPYSVFNLAKKELKDDKNNFVNGLPHIRTILRYISDNYDQKITISDIAKSTGLHPNYAMTVFNQVMKISIKKYSKTTQKNFWSNNDCY